MTRHTQGALPTWGVVATVKASATEILNFVAHHLDLGAAHIWIYLDAPNPEAKPHLKGHPQVTVINANDNYWTTHHTKKPQMHQNRQVANASHAYARAGDVDWLVHIDVDEFLWPQHSVAASLAPLPTSCIVARVRPAEAMETPGGNGDMRFFKAFVRDKQRRWEIVSEIYPTYALYLKGGFVSHVEGKMFVRTGQPNIKIKIHNTEQGAERNPGQVELLDLDLLHFHAASWAHWAERFSYRHRKGSYRDSLRAATPKEQGGLNLHQLFAHLSEDPEGLRRFYEEVCLASPQLRAKLDKHGLLRAYDLALSGKRRKHFPEFTKSVSANTANNT